MLFWLGKEFVRLVFLNINLLIDGYWLYVSIGDDVNSLSGCWRIDDINYYEKLFDSLIIEDILIIMLICLWFEVLLYKFLFFRWMDGFVVVWYDFC